MTDNLNSDNKVFAHLPFEGEWLVFATPAHRVPSHGTEYFGVKYAIDFLAVDDKSRTSKKAKKTYFLE